MIRILHTADWHLGQTFFGYDRTEEHEAFLDWLAGEILRQEIDALIIAGDVFDVSIRIESTYHARLLPKVYIIGLYTGLRRRIPICKL